MTATVLAIRVHQYRWRHKLEAQAYGNIVVVLYVIWTKGALNDLMCRVGKHQSILLLTT